MSSKPGKYAIFKNFCEIIVPINLLLFSRAKYLIWVTFDVFFLINNLKTHDTWALRPLLSPCWKVPMLATTLTDIWIYTFDSPNLWENDVGLFLFRYLHREQSLRGCCGKKAYWNTSLPKLASKIITKNEARIARKILTMSFTGPSTERRFCNLLWLHGSYTTEGRF